jgi:hypothetical protein
MAARSVSLVSPILLDYHSGGAKTSAQLLILGLSHHAAANPRNECRRHPHAGRGARTWRSGAVGPAWSRRGHARRAAFLSGTGPCVRNASRSPAPLISDIARASLSRSGEIAAWRILVGALDPRKVAEAIDRAMCAGLFIWCCNELRAPVPSENSIRSGIA